MQPRPKLSTLAAIALVAANTIALQVVLTRLFSAVLAYHFSFLTISLAMLGTGGGALFVYLSPRRWERAGAEEAMARWCLLFALALFAVPFALVRIDFGTGDSLEASFVVRLVLACAVAALPSFASGVVIALAVSHLVRWVGLVYAFDLMGAGLGAAAVVPLLGVASAPRLLLALAACTSAAALAIAGAHARTRGLAAALVSVSALAFAITTDRGLLYLSPGLLSPDATILADRWNPLSRVVGAQPPGSPRWAAVLYDRAYAPVPIVRGDGIPDWRQLRTGPQSIGYELTGPGRALVIGGGGGRDIYTALAARQRRVDVIELNPGIREVVDEDMGALSGRPYSRARVRATIGDGRSVLAARDVRYDQIHVGFTDTLSIGAAQGFALSENNLYTVEAFDGFLDHLEPRGVLNVSRIAKAVGDEALRATVLALATLERRGAADARRHVVVVRGRGVLNEEFGTVLARNEPFSDAELDRIARLASERGLGLVFAPGIEMRDEWRALAEAPTLQAFCRGHRFDVCPPTDDRPFFLSMRRLADVGRRDEGYIFVADPTSILFVTAAVLLVLALVTYAAPLLAVERSRRPRLGSLVYFAAIGFGFMLTEISLIQRFVLFLGYPTYALSVVLFALLVSTGLGSYLTTRARDPRRLLLVGLSGASLLIAIGAFALQPLLRQGIGLPFAARVVATVLVLAPLGLLLGVAMPIGLRRLEALDAPSVPYAWGVNGVASVLASALGVGVAIHVGFSGASLLAAGCYLLALASGAARAWPGGSPTNARGANPPRPERRSLPRAGAWTPERPPAALTGFGGAARPRVQERFAPVPRPQRAREHG